MQGEEITFIGKRWSSSKSLAASALVCALGVAAIALGYTKVGIALLLGAAVPATRSLRAALLPASRYLRLDSSGFEVGLQIGHGCSCSCG